MQEPLVATENAMSQDRCCCCIDPNSFMRLPFPLSIICWMMSGREPPPYFDLDTWHDLAPAAGDVVVATPPKCGTNWMLNIVHQLRTQGEVEFADILHVAPWPELVQYPGQRRRERLDYLREHYDGRFPFRVFKSHLAPGQRFPLHQEVRYVVVVRESKDVAVSMLPFPGNHSAPFKRIWGNFPPPFRTFQQCLDRLMAAPKVYWELVKAWWAHRTDPNVLLVHFNDLKRDLPGSLRRIAAFLQVHIPEAKWPRVEEQCGFAWMKANASKFDNELTMGPHRGVKCLNEGTLIRQGEVGEHKAVFSEQQLRKWEKFHAKQMPDEEMREWADNGGWLTAAGAPVEAPRGQGAPQASADSVVAPESVGLEILGKPETAEDGAARLLQAWTSGRWIASREGYPRVESIADVYAIHAAMAAHPLSQRLGGLAGYKQGGMGVVPGEDAVYGLLFQSGLVQAGGAAEGSSPPSISKARHNMFGLEAEIGFVMGRDLPPGAAAGGRSEAEVFGAVAEVVLCVEYTGRRHTLADAAPIENLADACSGAGVVLGPSFPPDHADPSGLSPARLAQASARIWVGGEERASGRASGNPAGGPVASLTWCANHLNRRGLALKAGQIVIAGAICKTREFAGGDLVRAEFEGLGEVCISILP